MKQKLYKFINNYIVFCTIAHLHGWFFFFSKKKAFFLIYFSSTYARWSTGPFISLFSKPFIIIFFYFVLKS